MGSVRLSLQAAQVSVSDMVMASEDAGRTAYNQLLFNNRDQTSKTRDTSQDACHSGGIV